MTTPKLRRIRFTDDDAAGELLQLRRRLSLQADVVSPARPGPHREGLRRRAHAEPGGRADLPGRSRARNEGGPPLRRTARQPQADRRDPSASAPPIC